MKAPERIPFGHYMFRAVARAVAIWFAFAFYGGWILVLEALGRSGGVA